MAEEEKILRVLDKLQTHAHVRAVAYRAYVSGNYETGMYYQFLSLVIHDEWKEIYEKELSDEGRMACFYAQISWSVV